eukprot:COSAG02_NODE_5191_length_4553_cov_15.942524_2_plen_88_part_00
MGAPRPHRRGGEQRPLRGHGAALPRVRLRHGAVSGMGGRWESGAGGDVVRAEDGEPVANAAVSAPACLSAGGCSHAAGPSGCRERVA